MQALKKCPNCGKPAGLIRIQGGFAIICADKNCLSKMEIHYGTCDNKELFKQKLIDNWNERRPDVPAIAAALNCLEAYRDELERNMQEPYDEHGSCCLRALDEALNRLQCFTSARAVEAWEDQEQ